MLNIMYYLIILREIVINLFTAKIICLVDNKNQEIYKNKVVINIINLFPFFLVSNFLYILNKINLYNKNYLYKNYLYKKDDLIFYSKPVETKVTPCVLEIELVKNDVTNSENELSIKDNFNKYSSNVPVYLIIENENIKISDEDEIKIRLLESGKFVDKVFNYKKIKLFLKNEIY